MKQQCRMTGQVNNFYGQVGAAGVTNSNVVVDMTQDCSQNDSHLSHEILSLLSMFEGQGADIYDKEHNSSFIKLALSKYPQLNNSSLIQASIVSDPSLKQRVLAATSAATLETIKAFLPPLAIAIEAIKAFQGTGTN
jgi:hypothetical protein